MALKVNSSFSCVSTYLSSPCRRKGKLKLSSGQGLFGRKHISKESLSSIKGVRTCQLILRKRPLKDTLSQRQILFATSDDQQSFSELEPDDLELETLVSPVEDSASTTIPCHHIERAEGKPGFISFYGPTQRVDDENLVSSHVESRKSLLWLVGPTALVASFIFPSLYLRRILSSVFEDSLITDFLILFFTEAIFYCGAAVFLLLIDRLRRPTYAATSQNSVSLLGDRISSVAVLVLSLTIPTVTMGFVWPWTGPAASATLAPYLVGIIVQFAFEQYARYVGSPSWPAIPIIFQVYRLHQLNRAAQLVTALSFTVRGAEMTPHNQAINSSLSTLLNVLQFLGVICIWSLSSFIMRYFRPPPVSSET
ncbi:hypothetical protein ACS0TY_035667 [Phlomoides rotata]